MRIGRELVRRSCWISATLLMALTARADDPAGFMDAIRATRPIVDTRLRVENVDQDPMANEADAVTLRARLGFETGKAWDTALLAEGEFVWPLNDHYNSTTNGAVDYPVVPDPEAYELNRLQLTNTSIAGTTITLGRQRIALDDQRFVSPANWRQNEQTFDSVRIVNRSVQNLTVDVAYVEQVNRVFGPESVQGRYNGDSVLANVSWQFPIGKLTAFGYHLEFDPIAAVPAAVRESTATYGARFVGERAVSKVKLAYAATYANEKEAGANPLSFDLDYYLAELSATYQHYSLGAGIEVLEGDGVKGFTTPLATLHKFQGWADKFLVTPVDGITDRYLTAGFTLQRVGPLEALSALATQHWFEAERIHNDYGSETDLQLQAKWHRFTGLVKFADYNAEHFATDTSKFWLQLEYVW
jgi:hypothetical protein